ncbi:glycosyltransferase [Polymorphospora rubra]|uniref:glycosyltransferase n=1 Tax=Polymorphospora rubra TaxID=338584 RepID=UPI0033E7B159
MALILMVIHGTDGDVLPFVRVGRALRARGHDVTVLTHAYYRTAVHRAGLDLVAVDTVAEYERYLADAAGQFGETDIAQFRRHFDRTGLFDQLLLECREMLRLHRPQQTVLVGAPISGQSVLTAAEALDAPAVCLAASPFQLMALPGVAGVYRQVLADGVDAARAAIGLGPVTDWPGWMASARRYVGLWPAWFDAAGPPAPAGTDLAGFVLADEDAPDDVPPGARELLAGDVAPVLVTGGTGRLLQRRFYRTAVDAIRALGRPALLAVRHGDLVPDPLPPGVHRFARLPFRAVMPRAAAVVHHGGIGTLGRALAAGTPQVAMAAGLDRPDNARRLAAYGVGRWLPEQDWTADAVAAALRAAIDDPPPAVPDPLAATSVERAADAVESVLPDLTRRPETPLSRS